MQRFLLSVVVVCVMLAVAPTANAQITNLYNTIEGPQTVQGVNSVPVGPSFLGTFRAATSFVPTRSGTASVLSMRGQCVVPYPQGTTCEGIGEVSIQADRNGRPSGVSLGTMGFYLTDSLTTGNPVKRECGRLSPNVQLTAGTKYWAVMTAPDGIGWNDWTDDRSEVLESIDDGAWTTAPNSKRLALRIDAGVDECVPDAKTNPTPATGIANMYVRNGVTAWDSVSLENQGLVPLTWSSVEFDGPDASVFRLLNSQPGPLAGEFRFPRQIGVGGLTLMYPTCTGGTEERWYRSNLVLRTNDPDTPDTRIPIACLVDNTPPSVTYTPPQPDGQNRWFVKPIPVDVKVTDKEPSSGVTSTACGRGWEGFSSFGPGLSLLMHAEGVSDLNCSATDRSGNTGRSVATSFKLDTLPPVPEPVRTPPATEDGWNNTATVLRFDCRDPEPGSGVATPASGGGTVLSQTAGTDFTSSGCTDVAGHASTPVTATVRIDTTNPVISVANVTPAPNAAGWHRTDVTIAWDCADTGVIQSGIKTDAVADTVWTRETAGGAVASAGVCADKAANQAGVVTQFVKLDKTAPTTTIDDGPAQFTNRTGAELPFSGNDALSGVAGYECRLDGGAFAPCSGTFQVSDLAEGTHTFAVRAIDGAGNPDATPATRIWTVDTVAPETRIATGPDAPTSSRSAAFTYGGDALGGTAISGYQCRLDGGTWGACQDYTGLADRAHTFEVRAIDAAGNADDTPAARTWTVDTVAPDTAVTTGPAAATSSRAASFTYSGDPLSGTAISGYECRLDGGAWGACRTYSDLSDGEHTFAVRAVDAAGNTDDSPAGHTWRVDTVAPDTDLTRGPDAETSASTASFEYEGRALGGSDVARFQCSLDGADWGACADEYRDLRDGLHRFEVRAVDAAGNQDGTPAAHSWTVDTAAPDTSIATGPDPVTASRTAAFTYAGDALGGTAIKRYECSLDNGAWGACAAYADLATGEHTFRVRAVDGAGNEDTSPATRTWAIDLTAPVTTITAKPAPRTPAREARFTLAATDAGGSTVAGFECSLDEQDFEPCTSPVRYTGLIDGDHTFAVRATDGVGNHEDPGVSYTWTVSGLVAVDDRATTRANAPVVIDVAGNDQRPAQATITADAASAHGGAVAAVPAGIRYTPPAGFSGTDTFGYELAAGGDTSRATVTVTVTPATRAGTAPTVSPGRANLAPKVTIARDGRCGQSRSGTFRLWIDNPDGSPVRVTGTTSSDRVRLVIGGGGGERTVSISRTAGLHRATVRLRVTDGPHVIEIPIGLAVGTAGADRIRGTAGPDLLFGLGGRDRIAGRGGDDLLCGGRGPDRLDGGAGNDVLIAGRGNDVVRGGAGNDHVRGDGGSDRVIGGAGDDVLRGGPRADVFRPAPGADRLLDYDPEKGDERA